MGETEAWGHHNSPKDRGSADRYYGRRYSPHCWQVNDDKTMARVGQDKMTGDTFTVQCDHRRWGKLERDICVVDNGTGNNGGYWVSDSYEEICNMIKN